MDTVKTYDKVNGDPVSLEIRIDELITAYEKSQGKPDEPHRHDFYTVLLVEKSQGKHLIDFNEYPFGEKQVFFVAPGQVHQVVDEIPPKGFAVLFSQSFLLRNNISEHFIHDLNLFHDFGYAPPVELSDESMQKICSYGSDMFTIQNNPKTFSSEALGALLKLILIECHQACTLPNDLFLQSENGKSSLIRNFKELIESNYQDWHGVQDYAENLNISTDHLNRVVKAQTGKTAKEHIQSKIVVEAKRLLYFSDMSSKEIGYLLGFSEPANFSAFFKKQTGSSPSNFQPKN